MIKKIISSLHNKKKLKVILKAFVVEENSSLFVTQTIIHFLSTSYPQVLDTAVHVLNIHHMINWSHFVTQDLKYKALHYDHL